MKIPVIYEDNHLLVVEKPPNMLSQGDETGDVDLLSLLKQDLKVRYNKPGNVYLGLVHRLDRPVGGVMVFAKTSKAASRLTQQLRDNEFTRIYLAVVHGKPPQRDRLVHYLLKDRASNMVSVVEEGTPGAKPAVLEYEVLDTADRLSLVRVQLFTGRPHQIRVQFAALGHPVYNDHKYGLGYPITGDVIALWSHKAEFNHPTRKERMSFTSFPKAIFPWTCFRPEPGPVETG